MTVFSIIVQNNLGLNHQSINNLEKTKKVMFANDSLQWCYVFVYQSNCLLQTPSQLIISRSEGIGEALILLYHWFKPHEKSSNREALIQWIQMKEGHPQKQWMASM